MSLPNLSFDVLLSLSSGPKYGYLMLTDIEQIHQGAYKPSVGMLYVTLQKLMDEGWVREDAPPADNTDVRRKYYALTASGLNTLSLEVQRKAQLVQQAQTRLDQFHC
jgi:DNA-binding PadR family transcriptional regulator